MTFDHDTAAVEAMAEAKAPVAPPDDASDLWGWPPRSPVRCPGCGRNAEPFNAPFCWLCGATGREASTRARFPARYLNTGY
jgi:predicted amidophosphoribosyltransferase